MERMRCNTLLINMKSVDIRPMVVELQMVALPCMFGYVLYDFVSDNLSGDLVGIQVHGLQPNFFFTSVRIRSTQ